MNIEEKYRWWIIAVAAVSLLSLVTGLINDTDQQIQLDSIATPEHPAHLTIEDVNQLIILSNSEVQEDILRVLDKALDRVDRRLDNLRDDIDDIDDNDRRGNSNDLDDLEDEIDDLRDEIVNCAETSRGLSKFLSCLENNL